MDLGGEGGGSLWHIPVEWQYGMRAAGVKSRPEFPGDSPQ